MTSTENMAVLLQKPFTAGLLMCLQFNELNVTALRCTPSILKRNPREYAGTWPNVGLTAAVRPAQRHGRAEFWPFARGRGPTNYLLALLYCLFRNNIGRLKRSNGRRQHGKAKNRRRTWRCAKQWVDNAFWATHHVVRFAGAWNDRSCAKRAHSLPSRTILISIVSISSFFLLFNH